MAQTDTLRLTVAQAIVKWLMAQHILIEEVETRICGGGFGIFGHRCLFLFNLDERLSKQIYQASSPLDW